MKASIARGLRVLFAGVFAPVADAQERTCADGMRSYFGVCPDGSNNSRPQPGGTPRNAPDPITPPAPQRPAPSPYQGSNAPSPQWLSSRLYGSDNRVAALRQVTISASDGGGWSVLISNQFSFKCEIEFDSNGDPSRLKNCKSGEAGWIATPSNIPVTCSVGGAERVCKGRYTLGTISDPTSWGVDFLTIARRN
jgi:hypothetical protein